MTHSVTTTSTRNALPSSPKSALPSSPKNAIPSPKNATPSSPSKNAPPSSPSKNALPSPTHSPSRVPALRTPSPSKVTTPFRPPSPTKATVRPLMLSPSSPRSGNSPRAPNSPRSPRQVTPLPMRSPSPVATPQRHMLHVMRTGSPTLITKPITSSPSPGPQPPTMARGLVLQAVAPTVVVHSPTKPPIRGAKKADTIEDKLQRRKMPEWAKGDALKSALQRQYRNDVLFVGA